VSPRASRIPIALALVLGAAGCAPVLGLFGRGEPSAWRDARGAAAQAVRDGRYAVADSVLVQYARQRPKSDEAHETLYWRALYRLDPANPESSAGAAAQLFDAYLSDPTADRHLEATFLRRAAISTDSLERQVASLRAAIDDATGREADSREGAARDRTERDRGDRSREQELKRLREELAAARTELASTKEELDRIKKRLATPRP
jgi:hypothetical protein